MAEEKKDEAKPEGKKLDIGKILGLLFIVADIAGIGTGAYLTYMGTLGYHPPVIREPQAIQESKIQGEGKDGEPEALLYSLEPIVVNLSGYPRRVIRLGLTLEMLDGAGFEEVVTLGSQSRDEIMKILNAKNFADIQSLQGKLHLKDEVATHINTYLKKGVVKDVYFTEFLVQ